MKIFWSWQSDTPKNIGRFLVRDALNDAVEKLKQGEKVEDAPRDIHLDHDIKNVLGSPDLVRTILDKIEKSEVVVADVTIVGKTAGDKSLINSNVAIELGYAWHVCTDARVLLDTMEHTRTFRLICVTRAGRRFRPAPRCGAQGHRCTAQGTRG